MYKLKLGISLKYFKDNGVVREEFESELNEAVRLGFESIDFDITGINTLDVMLTVEEALQKGIEKVRSSGLFFNAVHLPFRTGDYSGDNETLRRELICNTINLFRIIDPYEPNCYIFHGSVEGWNEDKREKKLQILKDSLETLVATTKTMVCVENLPRLALLNTSEEAVALVDSVENAKICCDVNHFLQETAEAGLKKMGARIGTLHISDHDYVNERHMLPKKGKIDWMAVISALEEINYDGVFTYEITFAQNGYIFCSLKDVKENYDELFREYEEEKLKKEKDLNKSIIEKTFRLWNNDIRRN